MFRLLFELGLRRQELSADRLEKKRYQLLDVGCAKPSVFVRRVTESRRQRIPRRSKIRRYGCDFQAVLDRAGHRKKIRAFPAASV